MPKKFQASFTAGELDPKLHARVDLAKYASGAARLLNMQVHPYGGASNRPGDEFVAAAKDERGYVRLVEFQLSASDTCILEFGEFYMRVIRRGVVVQAAGGGDYVLATPYPADRVKSLRFEQTNDVVKITAIGVKPQNLSRFDNNNWQFSDLVITPTIAAPNDLTGVAVKRPLATDGSEGGDYSVPCVYAVTSIDAVTGRESPPSTFLTLSNDLTHAGFVNELAFTKVPGASSFNVYKQKQSVFGIIGTVLASQPPTLGPKVQSVDRNYVPDTTSGIPTQKNPFQESGDYPRSSSVFQQRSVYGGPANKPNLVVLSQSGDYDNFNTSTPTKASDAITFALAGRQRQDVLFFVAVEDLIIFTLSGEWRVRGNDSGVISPSSIDAKQQSAYGCAQDIQPLIIDDDILFVQAKGQAVRSIAYDFGQNKYKGLDVSLLAKHLFERRTVVQMAHAQAPFSTVYFVMSDGALLTLTYLKDEQVTAWSVHRTDGLFESVCCVSEDQEDVPYFVVARSVGGVSRRYIERRRSRDIRSAQGAFFVDSGLTYSGPATATVSGMGHLEGRLVSGTVDGVKVRNLPVSGGRVDLPLAGSVISLGLHYTSEIETLDIDVGAAALNGELRNVTKVVLHVERTAGLFYGQADGKSELYSHDPRPEEGDAVDAGGLFTGSYEARYEGVWDNAGRILLRMDLLPATVLAVVPEFKAGGDSGNG